MTEQSERQLEPEQIEVQRQPERGELERRGVFLWDVWTKDVASFPWTYARAEVCYFLEGQVTVTPEGGEPIHMGAGDLVSFAAGLVCHWEITAAVRKHYTLR